MAVASHYERSDLARIACEVMRERGLEPEFPAAVQEQLRHLKGPRQEAKAAPLHDLTGLPWCSLDNDDSRDLDQLTACTPQHGGAVTIFVAVADVDALVEQGSPIDRHAWHNTTAVYTSARNFPLLPERLSTDLSSLNPHVERLAVVTEMLIAADGTLQRKSEAALLLQTHLGQRYDALVTGRTDSGTWVRILTPPVEGRLAFGNDDDLAVGRALRVQLVSVDVARGYIDFTRVD